MHKCKTTEPAREKKKKNGAIIKYYMSLIYCRETLALWPRNEPNGDGTNKGKGYYFSHSNYEFGEQSELLNVTVSLLLFALFLDFIFGFVNL